MMSGSTGYGMRGSAAAGEDHTAQKNGRAKCPLFSFDHEMMPPWVRKNFPGPKDLTGLRVVLADHCWPSPLRKGLPHSSSPVYNAADSRRVTENDGQMLQNTPKAQEVFFSTCPQKTRLWG